MATDTWSRTHEEMIDALAEGLQAVEEKLASLSEEDWSRPTLLRPLDPEMPPWNVLQLAGHFDFFMGMTMGLVGEPQDAPPAFDRVSFQITERHQFARPIYQVMIDHARGHTPTTILDTARGTFKRALETIRNTPPDTVGPAFYGLIRLDEFVPTGVLEVVIHAMDVTDALGEPPLPLPRGTTVVAEILDELVARKRVPGRPADLEDDLTFIRAASGRGEHPDARYPVIG
jgi:uncharacterized protein (TIGR03083 family)